MEIVIGGIAWFGCGAYGVYRLLRRGIVDQVGDGLLSGVLLLSGPIGLGGLFLGEWLWEEPGERSD